MVTTAPYAIRVDRRDGNGPWTPLFFVEHNDRDRALRDMKWAAGDERYGPHGARKMTLLGPDHVVLERVVEGPAL